MKQTDLIKLIATASGQPSKTVDAILKTAGLAVSSALLEGEDVALPGIGKFVTEARPARTGRNPKTGEKIAISAKTVVRFKPYKGLTDALNENL